MKCMWRSRCARRIRSPNRQDHHHPSFLSTRRPAGRSSAGTYRVTLAKTGYGSKTSSVEIGGDPIQFRLPRRRTARLHVAKVGPRRRDRGVPRPRRRTVSTDSLAPRTPQRVRLDDRLAGRTRPASQSPDTARWRFSPKPASSGTVTDSRRRPPSSPRAHRSLLLSRAHTIRQMVLISVGRSTR